MVAAIHIYQVASWKGGLTVFCMYGSVRLSSGWTYTLVEGGGGGAWREGGGGGACVCVGGELVCLCTVQ